MLQDDSYSWAMMLEQMRSMAATQLRSVFGEVETSGCFGVGFGGRRQNRRLECSIAVGKAPETRRQFALPSQNITVYQVRTVTGAVEKTRTSTAFRPQRPQRCASTSSATTARA